MSRAATDAELARMPGAGPAVRLTGNPQGFGSVVAADGIDLEIAEGEFFTMLGPSGSGKTTLLRMIAGLRAARRRARSSSAGVDVTRQPPYLRNVNTVFQDYALFPHMTVLENVEYGLRVRKVAARRAARRGPSARSTSSGSPGSANASRCSSRAASASGSRSRGRS